MILSHTEVRYLQDTRDLKATKEVSDNKGHFIN